MLKEHNCGVLIDCLEELARTLHTADYAELKENAMRVVPLLQQGYYLRRAIDIARQEELLS